MTRIGLVLKLAAPGATPAAPVTPGTPGLAITGPALAIARDLVPWLAGRGVEVLTPASQPDIPGALAVPDEALASEVELIVVLGGDGTLLAAASLIADRRVPVLGINLGRLGFLVAFDPSDARHAVERALAGKLTLDERMRLLVTVHRHGTPVFSQTALNDAVVSQASDARIIDLTVMLDGGRVASYKADGVIVSTPSGSTAYNLAAGGPMLVPWQAAMAITPICPHMLTNRPIVVPGDSRVQVLIGGERDARVSIDGRPALPLDPGDSVEVCRAATPLLLYRSDKPYFEILREKLKWGEHALR